MNAKTVRRFWIGFWVIIVALLTIAPLYWMIATSFKNYFDLGAFPPEPVSQSGDTCQLPTRFSSVPFSDLH